MRTDNRHTIPSRDISLAPADDHRHTLKSGEHEAFYFPFTSPEGNLFGFMRTLFDQDIVLEIMALHIGGCVWIHQHRAPLPDSPVTAAEASGPSLSLTCSQPWQEWDCRFHSSVRQLSGEKTLQANLDLKFVSTNAPAVYSFGTYHQAQQDGRLRGQIQVGAEEWAGELLCYRDHSWGQRPIGMTTAWTIASAPDRFHVIAAEVQGQPLGFGRFVTPDGQLVPVRIPRITVADTGWRIEDVKAGLAPWHVQRLAPPLVFYLGPPGYEAFRDGPRPGDLYLDELGPAIFTSLQGEQVAGFLDQARRLE